MEKRIYMKPLLKSFLIEPMDFLAASPNPKPSESKKNSFSFSDNVTSGDNDDTDPWEDLFSFLLIISLASAKWFFDPAESAS